MNLSAMRFKDYTWPHNPRVYGIEYRKALVSHRVPGGLYVLQNMGREHRVLWGEGEFAGPGAYDEFRKLATVFYENTPGPLIHPVWQEADAYFVSLSLRQEPTENYVAYSFEFWEDSDGYSAAVTPVTAAASALSSEEYYTAAAGESLWTVADKSGVSIGTLVALNQGLKRINRLSAGDRVRLR